MPTNKVLTMMLSPVDYLERQYSSREFAPMEPEMEKEMKYICKAPMRSRKRVRFEEEEEEEAPKPVSKKQMIASSFSSSEWSECEREEIWYTQSNFRAGLKSTEGLAIEFVQSARVPCNYEAEYSDVLTTTYAACCLAESDDCQVSEELAHGLAVVTDAGESCRVGECNRGLERITVPAYGCETQRRRKLAIESVVSTQMSLAGQLSLDDNSEFLRIISESQTLPSRNFAKSLGFVDAMSALVEYQSMGDDIPQENTSDQRLGYKHCLTPK
jgi:hypothetical protein